MFIPVAARRNLVNTPNLFRCFIHEKSLKTEKPLDENDSSSSSSHQSAVSFSKKFKVDTTTIPGVVTSTFKSYDFTDAQITKILTKFPQLLRADTEKIIKPKLNYYLNLGYSLADLGKFVSADPRALAPSLEKRIKPNVGLIRSFLRSDQLIRIAIRRSPWLLQGNLDRSFLSNIRTLESYGVDNAHIAQLISTQPRYMMGKSDKLVKVLKSVKELGFDPTSFLFVKAVIVLSGLSNSSWDRKVGIYKSLGLSEKDIISTFVKHPQCMALSEDKIRRVTDFYMKELHWEPLFLMERPILLCISLENRIIPRCLVMNILASKGFVKRYPSERYGFLLIGKTKFLGKYVTKYKDQVPELLDMFKVKLKDHNQRILPASE